jgi:hypothetical protein
MPPKKSPLKRKPEAEAGDADAAGSSSSKPSIAIAAATDGGVVEDGSPAAKKPKKAKKEPLKPPPQAVIARQAAPTPTAAQTVFTAMSWNVDGIRAAGRRERLHTVLEEDRPDLLCIQETKLQEQQE